MATGASLFSETNPVGYSYLLDLCRDPEEFRIYLFKSGLLGDRTGICESCKQGNVYLTKKEGSFYWKCGARACRKTISITKGSFFERSKLDFKVILCLIFCWIYELPIKFILADKLVSTNKSIADWKNFCHDVCVDILISDNRQIGGRGHIVEIDESKFGKRKYNRGRAVDGCWVLGGIDRETKETFSEIVEDRSAETLLPILIKNIHPETTVISDCWKANDKLSQLFREHQQINHSLHFVDPNNPKLYTNTIESQWRVLKRNTLPKNGTNHRLYSSYFSVYCVKQRYLASVPCPFKGFLELIKRVYRLDPCERTPRKDLRSDKENAPTSPSVNPPTSTSQRSKRPLPLEFSDDDDFQ